jgi:succinoglycan biosynthesis transport protein ExoP
VQKLNLEKALSLTETHRGRREAILPETLAALPGTSAVLPVAAATASSGEFLRILWRHRRKLALLLVLLLSAAVLVQLTVPKVYEATAVVSIDHSPASIDTEPQSYTQPLDNVDQVITTEMALVSSDTVLRSVAEKYNLWDLEKQTKGMTPAEVQALKAAPITLHNLKVKRPPNSSLIEISYRANDPRIAANVSNAIAESLAEHSGDSERASLAETAGSVQRSLKEIQVKMNQSDEELASYEAQLGIMNPEEQATVLSSRLKDLTSDLTVAQADRANREATMRQIQDIAAQPPTQALAAAQVADSIGLPGNSSLSEAVAKLNDARAHFAAAKSFYDTRHPEYVRASDQVQEMEAQVSSMIKGAASRAQIAYQQARSRENNLMNLVNRTKAEVDAMQSKVGQYDQLRDQARSDRRFYEDLLNRTRIADINKSYNAASAQIFSAARPAVSSIFPKLSINLAVAFLLACLLGPIIAVLLDAIDTKFSSPADVVSRLQLDVLAVVPESKWLPRVPANLDGSEPETASQPSGRKARAIARYKESIRVCRTSLTYATQDGWLKTIQVTSSAPGEGKTTLTAALALAYAQVRKKVLLIDANVRDPMIHRFFQVPLSPGLSDVLEDKIDFREAIVKLDGGLSVMPAGPASGNSPELISMHFPSVLARATREYDLILIDCPPVNGAAETLELCRIVDGTIVVLNSGKSGGDLVTHTANAIKRAQGQILGLVFNRARDFDDYTQPYAYIPALDSEAPDSPKVFS